MNQKMIFETIRLDLRVGIYNAGSDESIIFDQVAYRQSTINLMAFTNYINENIADDLHRNLDEQIKYINSKIQRGNDDRHANSQDIRMRVLSE